MTGVPTVTSRRLSSYEHHRGAMVLARDVVSIVQFYLVIGVFSAGVAAAASGAGGPGPSGGTTSSTPSGTR